MAKFDGLIKKSKELIKEKVDKLPEGMNSEELKKSMKNLIDASADTFANMRKRAEENAKAVKEALRKSEEETNNLTIEDALRIIYFLMAVDGKISEEEQKKFIEVANEMDKDFYIYNDEFVDAMNQFINSIDEDYDHYINDYVAEAVRHSRNNVEAVIPAKVLIWNLLVIGFSDGECLDIEKKLIRYCAKQLDLDKSVILEFEGYVRTLMAIIKEEEWLKTSNRSYIEVEKELNELADRKLVIMQGVSALIME